MRAADREKLCAMFGGCCAYCGREITPKTMHADHVEPVYRDRTKKPFMKDRDVLANLFPACAPCNRWKATWTLDQFRKEIEAQPERLRRYSSAFRMAERFSLIKWAHPITVIFWFEMYRSARKEGQP